MIILEKLYEISDKHLAHGSMDWAVFAGEFEEVIEAKMALYRPSVQNKENNPVTSDEVLATTSHQIMHEYFKEKIYQNNDLQIDPESPFEPVKRTDNMSDLELQDLWYWDSFLRPHDIFYVMAIFAIMPDGSYLVLMLWRDSKGVDFSDLEKQRLAIFMRHLAAIASASMSNSISLPGPAIQMFGKKYKLTDSETIILSALIQGQTLRTIASETNRTYGTLRWHVHNILEKCQVKTQQNLLAEFYKLIKR